MDQIYQYRYLRALCFFLFLYHSHLLADLASETVYLTWQQSPETTMTIQWISPVDETPSVVFYRNFHSPEWIRVNGQVFHFPYTSEYVIHSVQLTQLEPASNYLFTVNSHPSTYAFHTMPHELQKSITFVEGGDMYHDDISLVAATCQEAAKLSPDFALLGGDLAYAVSSSADKEQDIDQWIQWIKNWHATMVTPEGHLIPVLSAIGNHDLLGHFDQTLSQAAIFRCLFPSPNYLTYRTVDFGCYLSLFLLDSGHACTIQGEQLNWLKTSLQQRTNVLHQFAAYHVPAYPAARSFSNKRSLAIRHFWVPAFEQGNIQLAFEHHDHIYKRTYPLLKNQIHSQGIIYLGDGGWGVKKMRSAAQNREQKKYFSFVSPTRHFIHITLTPTSQSIKAITDQGEILDKLERQLVIPEPVSQN